MELGGWYPDPDGEPDLVRWWDGNGWTEHTAPARSARARRPPEAPRSSWWQRRRGAAPVLPEPAMAARHDWRDRTGPHAAPAPDEPPAPYEDPAAGIYAAPYEAAAAPATDPVKPVPYEDPAAGIYAAPVDEPATSAGTSPPPVYPDVITGGREPGRLRSAVRGPTVGVAAIVLLIVGVVVAGMMLSGGNKSNSDEPLSLNGPTSSPDNRPPLEQMCANTAPSRPDSKAPPAKVPPGPRIADPLAHISYAAQGQPFRLWDLGPWENVGGGLGEVFTTGQYFITQADTPDNSPYMATVLSGTVPATYSDDPHPNIECAARVIGDDVRKSYYPQPNSRTSIAAKEMTISGRPAYLLEFHLAFDQPGFDAKGELVAICVIDVPGTKAAALYISIPDTHKQYDSIVQPLMNSIRVG